MRSLRIVLTSVTLAAALVAPGMAATIYVSPDGTGDGTTPGAPASLQAALDIAKGNGQDDALLLRQGTYEGTTFTYDVTGDAADADAGLTLFGGYATDFLRYDPDPALTVLSGGGARRVLSIDARRQGRVVDVELVFLTVSDGFSADGDGGGVLGLSGVSAGQHGAITLLTYECLFLRNHVHGTSAQLSGGAVFLEGSISTENTDFIDNQANRSAAVHAQIYDWGTPALHDHALPASFTWGIFRNNTADGANGPVVMTVAGGALTMQNIDVENTTGLSSGVTETILAIEGPVKIDNCRFRGNIVDKWASAIDLLGAPAQITNTLFDGNWAGQGGVEGGGLITGWNYDYAGGVTPAEHISVVNCTFVNNKGLVQGANRSYSILDLQSPQTATFDNCIFEGNDIPAVAPRGSTYVINYSDIDGGWAANNFTSGASVVDVDPHFQAGDTDYKLNFDSPLIDAGNNDAVPAWMLYDFKGALRIFASAIDRQNPRVDMGWDEYVDYTLELTAPAWAAVWRNDGTAKSITWYCNNIGGDVNVGLWEGSFGPGPLAEEFTSALCTQEGGLGTGCLVRRKVLDIATVPCADQEASWIIPADLQPLGSYGIVITPVFYPTVERVAAVTIQQILTLTAPNGGQSVIQGSTRQITWSGSKDLAGATVRIQLYKGAALVRTIATAAPNTGSFYWKVGYAAAPGSDYRIRVSTATPFVAADSSDAPFTIAPALTLTAPNGGQFWKRGRTYTVAWTYRYSPGSAVRLDLYKAGVLNRTIAASVPIGAAGRGSYAWTIPAAQVPAGGYTVRVRSTANPNCFDVSNKAFTITR
ncbi:MAG TPA: Ser-Thr-rich GPI-anchored membrane family protein [bacterium]